MVTGAEAVRLLWGAAARQMLPASQSGSSTPLRNE